MSRMTAREVVRADLMKDPDAGLLVGVLLMDHVIADQKGRDDRTGAQGDSPTLPVRYSSSGQR